MRHGNTAQDNAMQNNSEHSNKKKRKHNPWPWIFGLLLTGYAVFTLLDAFVIPRDIVDPNSAEGNRFPQYNNPYVNNDFLKATPAPETDVPASPTPLPETDPPEGGTQEPEKTATQPPTPSPTPVTPIITENRYLDEDISVELTTVRVHDTQIYYADVRIRSIAFLRSGLAGGVFGRNILESTSAIAEKNQAILAINGDYYGFRDRGYVLRNGFLYRELARNGNGYEDLAVYLDGHFEIVREADHTAEDLARAGAVQIFSFGPGLVQNGAVTVDEYTEVEQSLSSNPRTAIGEIEPLHYILLVSDGRTRESAGLTLLQLAEFLQSLGCRNAYNLDGGGSSTMWFLGRIVNKPTAYGDTIAERKVSDIVYIGKQ